MWQQEQREADRLAAAAATAVQPYPTRPRPGPLDRATMQLNQPLPRAHQQTRMQETRGQSDASSRLEGDRRAAQQPQQHQQQPIDSHPQRARGAVWSSPIIMPSSQQTPHSMPTSPPPPPRRLASLSNPAASFAAVVSRASLTSTFERARLDLASTRRADAAPARLQPLVLPPISQQPKQRSPQPMGAESDERKQPLDSQACKAPPSEAAATLAPGFSPPLTANSIALPAASDSPDVPFDALFSTDGAHLSCRFRAVDLHAFLVYCGLKVYHYKLLQAGFHALSSLQFVPRGVLEDVGMTSREIGVLRDALERLELRRDEHVQEEKYDVTRPKSKPIEHVSRGVCVLRSSRSASATAAPVPSSSTIDSSSGAEASVSEAKRSSPFAQTIAAEDVKMDSSPKPAESSTADAPMPPPAEASPRFPQPMPALELPPSAIKPPSHTPPPPPPVPQHWQPPPSKPLYVMQNCGPRVKPVADSAPASHPPLASPHIPLAAASASAAATHPSKAAAVASADAGSGSTGLDALIAKQMQFMEISLARAQKPAPVALPFAVAAPVSTAVAAFPIHPTAAAAQTAPPLQQSSISSGHLPPTPPTPPAPRSSDPLLLRMLSMHRRLERLCAPDGLLSGMEAGQAAPTAAEQRQPITASSISPAAGAAAPPLPPSPPKPHPPKQPHSETETVSSARRRRLRGGSWKTPPASATSSSVSTGSSSSRRHSSASPASRLPTANERRFAYDHQRREERKQVQQAHSKHSSQQHPQLPQQVHQPHSASHTHSTAHSQSQTHSADLASCPKRKAEEDAVSEAESKKKARATNESAEARLKQ